MILNELMDKILTLIPDAKFSVWYSEPPFPPEHDPSVSRETRFGFCVCWHKSNNFNCPTEEELSNLP